jgi:hypothetical protein
MKKGLLTLIAVSLSLASIPGRADSQLSATVGRLYPMSSGVVDVTFVTSNTACTNANNPPRYRLAVGVGGMTEEGMRNIMAVLMYAVSTNKDLVVSFDQTLSTCNITRVLISP